MRLCVIAVGRRGPAWLQQAQADYLKRFPRELRVELVEVAPARRTANSTPAASLKTEAARLLTAVPAGSRCIVLDQRGRALDTAALARELQRWRADGSDVAFLIGGADGTDAALRESAAAVWSLSALTLPHGMARLVLVEQLYRAWTILSGHPYHRE